MYHLKISLVTELNFSNSVISHSWFLGYIFFFGCMYDLLPSVLTDFSHFPPVSWFTDHQLQVSLN